MKRNYLVAILIVLIVTLLLLLIIGSQSSTPVAVVTPRADTINSRVESVSEEKSISHDTDAIEVYNVNVIRRRDDENSNAFFPGGENALMEFIESNRDQTTRIPDSLNHNNDIFLTLHVALAIDEQGKITNVNHPVYGGDVHFTDEIDSLVKKMPDWIPAYITDSKTQKRKTIKSNAGFDINYYFEGKSQQQGK